METKILISARHIHLCEKDFRELFGEKKLTKYADLTQPGQFASNEKVNLITNKGRIDNVRIVGPLRSYTQVEISKTDAYKLGLNPPVRSSGDLENSEDIWVEANGKRMLCKSSCIIADRHLHIRKVDLDKYNLKDKQSLKLKINGEKGGILDNVFVKATEEASFEVHLDFDDANAHLINSGDIGEIIY